MTLVASLPRRPLFILVVAATVLCGGLLGAARLVSLPHGLLTTYYANPTWRPPAAMPIATSQPSTASVAAAWRQSPMVHEPPSFSVTWAGWMFVPWTGSWTLATTSDDGSSVAIDKALVVDNGGGHAARLATGTTHLTAGFHEVIITFFQEGGAYQFDLAWGRDGAPLRPVAGWVLTPRRIGAPRLLLAHAVSVLLPLSEWMWEASVGLTAIVVAWPLAFTLVRVCATGWERNARWRPPVRHDQTPSRLGQATAMAAVFIGTLVPRVWGISRHFWLERDQTRDWGIALGSFAHLPLIGPATGVGGYTIGPAFYWILWLIRVTVGPWFHNLPHGGGIGQAMLDSGADALLLLAIWARLRSWPVAVATVVLVATAPLELSLAAIIWNPVVGMVLAKVATALVLLNWNDTPLRTAVTTAAAWSAVQCHTPNIFVAGGVFVALVAGWATRHGWPTAGRRTLLVGAVVLVLQMPYVVHQASEGFAESGLGAVGVSLGRISTGTEHLRWAESATAYVKAVDDIEAAPWHIPALPVWLVGCAVLVAVRFRDDLPLLSVTLLPSLAAVLGFAFWTAGTNEYYDLSLMPAATLTVVLGLRSLWPTAARASWGRVAQLVGTTVTLVAVGACVPARIRAAATMNRMPQYATLVTGSTALLDAHIAVRDITANFPLPAETDPGFIYTALGGRFDEGVSRIADIQADGQVIYRQ